MTTKKLTFKDIPQFTRDGSYEVDVSWSYLEEWIAHLTEGRDDQRMELDPDFQRGHVWDDTKRTRYIEFVLRGGRSARVLYWNHPNWMGSYGSKSKDPWQRTIVLVDGKQRLEAVRKFLRDEVPAFGQVYSEFGGRLNIGGPGFKVNVNNLKTKAEVLQWYLDLNSGGVVHTEEELARVRALLEQEKK